MPTGLNKSIDKYLRNLSRNVAPMSDNQNRGLQEHGRGGDHHNPRDQSEHQDPLFGNDTDEEESDLDIEEGAAGGHERPAAPAGEGGGGGGGLYVPPFEREHGLDLRQQAYATAFMAPHLAAAEFAINGNVMFLAHKQLLDRGVTAAQIRTLKNWMDIIEQLHDKQDRYEIGRNVGVDPFIDQINHMLKMSGLNLRDWNLMLGSVIFDGSDAHLQKVKRMVYASRYQGFDPSLILKKIIRSWRDARRQPRSEIYQS